MQNYLHVRLSGSRTGRDHSTGAGCAWPLNLRPSARVRKNPKLTAPAGLNIGIRHAAGDIIVRIYGRTIVEPDYVRRCVETLQRTGAGTVGGLQRAIGQNYLGKAIALTTSSPLAVGDSKFHYARQAGEVDTVYLGAFPREIFEQVGLYNEDLIRNQDYEFNCRIRQAGMARWRFAAPSPPTRDGAW